MEEAVKEDELDGAAVEVAGTGTGTGTGTGGGKGVGASADCGGEVVNGGGDGCEVRAGAGEGDRVGEFLLFERSIPRLGFD